MNFSFSHRLGGDHLWSRVAILQDSSVLTFLSLTTGSGLITPQYFGGANFTNDFALIHHQFAVDKSFYWHALDRPLVKGGIFPL